MVRSHSEVDRPSSSVDLSRVATRNALHQGALRAAARSNLGVEGSALAGPTGATPAINRAATSYHGRRGEKSKPLRLVEIAARLGEDQRSFAVDPLDLSREPPTSA